MASKIKWSDDRVRGAMTAILLIGRDRLSRGLEDDLIRAALVDYRTDPEGYKANKRIWPGPGETGPLKNPRHVAFYKNLNLALDRLAQKMEPAKLHFSSLLELDNWLVASLRSVR